MQAKIHQTRRMVVAFDLDDTLIPCLHEFATERLTSWRRLLAVEKLRLGTAELFRQLRDRGCDLWVYTTSFRTPISIRLLFLLHGIPLDGVVNQSRHQRMVSRSGKTYQNCSKYPPAFGIDLLIDESEGVFIESQRHGFRVIRILPDAPDWTSRILDEFDRLVATDSRPCR